MVHPVLALSQARSQGPHERDVVTQPTFLYRSRNGVCVASGLDQQPAMHHSVGVL